MIFEFISSVFVYFCWKWNSTRDSNYLRRHEFLEGNVHNQFWWTPQVNWIVFKCCYLLMVHVTLDFFISSKVKVSLCPNIDRNTWHMHTLSWWETSLFCFAPKCYMLSNQHGIEKVEKCGCCDMHRCCGQCRQTSARMLIQTIVIKYINTYIWISDTIQTAKCVF